MKREIAQNGLTPVLPKRGIEFEMTPINEQHIRVIALQASGEYLMKHIAGVMRIVEDELSQNNAGVLNEETLVAIEAQVKALAKELIQRSREQVV